MEARLKERERESPISGLLLCYFDSHHDNWIMFFMSGFLRNINITLQNFALCDLNCISQIYWSSFIMIWWRVMIFEIITQVCVSWLPFYTELVLFAPILYPIKPHTHSAWLLLLSCWWCHPRCSFVLLLGWYLLANLSPQAPCTMVRLFYNYHIILHIQTKRPLPSHLSLL